MAVDINLNLPIDTVPTNGSTNFIDSNAVFDGLALKQDTLVSGTNIKTINSQSLLGSGNIAISASPSGLTGQIQFNNSGAFGADSSLFWDNTNKRLGVGATPDASTRLDVRAQGALSTDLAFRVRNSADNANLIQIDGLGNQVHNAASGANPYIWNHAGTLQMKLEVASNSGLLRVYSGGVLMFDLDARSQAVFNREVFVNALFNATTDSRLTGTTSCIIPTGTGNNFNVTNSGTASAKFLVQTPTTGSLADVNSSGGTIIRLDSRSGEGAVQVKTSGSPTTSITDGFKLYSADIVAGNAAPHFRTENGTIIKLYQQTSTGTETAADIVQYLKNLGLLV